MTHSTRPYSQHVAKQVFFLGAFITWFMMYGQYSESDFKNPDDALTASGALAYRSFATLAGLICSAVYAYKIYTNEKKQPLTEQEHRSAASKSTAAPAAAPAINWHMPAATFFLLRTTLLYLPSALKDAHDESVKTDRVLNQLFSNSILVYLPLGAISFVIGSALQKCISGEYTKATSAAKLASMLLFNVLIGVVLNAIINPWYPGMPQDLDKSLGTHSAKILTLCLTTVFPVILGVCKAAARESIPVIGRMLDTFENKTLGGNTALATTMYLVSALTLMGGSVFTVATKGDISEGTSRELAKTFLLAPHRVAAVVAVCMGISYAAHRAIEACKKADSCLPRFRRQN